MINKEEYPTGSDDIQKEIDSLFFNDNVSPGDIKVTIQPRNRTGSTRFNADGMFSDHELDILFTLVYKGYLAGIKEPMFVFATSIHAQDKKILQSFLKKAKVKHEICAKIMKVFVSVAVLGEYGMLVIEDAMLFFKELKRLRRRSSTKTQSKYYFSGVV